MTNLNRKRSRSSLFDDDSLEFTPLSKRINNLHINATFLTQNDTVISASVNLNKIQNINQCNNNGHLENKNSDNDKDACSSQNKWNNSTPSNSRQWNVAQNQNGLNNHQAANNNSNHWNQQNQNNINNQLLNNPAQNLWNGNNLNGSSNGCSNFTNNHQHFQQINNPSSLLIHNNNLHWSDGNINRDNQTMNSPNYLNNQWISNMNQYTNRLEVHENEHLQQNVEYSNSNDCLVYNPDLTVNENPFYYESNKLLFDLFVSRSQRSKLTF